MSKILVLEGGTTVRETLALNLGRTSPGRTTLEFSDFMNVRLRERELRRV